MKKAALRYLDPSQFFREFSPELTHAFMSQPKKTPDGALPSQNIFCIMRIEEVGKYIRFPIPIGRSTVYELCWLKEGKMVRTNGLVNYDINKNNICFWRAGAIKGTESLSKDAKGYYCFFDKDFVLQFLRDQKSLDELPFFRDNGRSLIQLAGKTNSSIRSLLEKLEKEYLDDLPDKNRMLGLLLCQLLVTSKRLSSELVEHEAQTSGEILSKKFLAAIKLNAKEQRTVQFYADLFSVTANYLNKCVKIHTGKPATFHITTMVVLEAKIMLRQTLLSVSEVASELGFDDVSYFSRMFHKNAGMTPKKYKNQATGFKKE